MLTFSNKASVKLICTLMHAYSISKDDIEAFSIDELSEHLIVDKLFPASEIESLEGKPE